MFQIYGSNFANYLIQSTKSWKLINRASIIIVVDVCSVRVNFFWKVTYSSAFSQQCNTYEVKYDHYLNGVRDKLLALPWTYTNEVLMSIKMPKYRYFLESLSTNSATVSTLFKLSKLIVCCSSP